MGSDRYPSGKEPLTMKRRLKLILGSAVIAALTVAGLSVAAGGGDDGGGSSGSTAAPAKFAANGNGERGRRFFRFGFPDADVRAVLDDIRDAVAKQAPEIADPIIDKAESDGKITKDQADKLRQAAQDIAEGKRPDVRGLGRDSDVHAVIHDAFAAAAKKAQELGEPIITKAVDDKKITEAQADRIREMLEHAPPGPGFGPGGPHRFHLPPIDNDMQAVLEDIHKAAADDAKSAAKSVIDNAESDGKITASQADKLRELASNIGSGKPPGPPPSADMSLLRDSDVRDVLHDAFTAAAKKTKEVAGPIIDKAVSDKKITAAQGRQLKRLVGGKFGVHFDKGPRHGHFAPGGPPPGRPGFFPGPPPGNGQGQGGSVAPATPTTPGTPS